MKNKPKKIPTVINKKTGESRVAQPAPIQERAFIEQLESVQDPAMNAAEVLPVADAVVTSSVNVTADAKSEPASKKKNQKKSDVDADKETKKEPAPENVTEYLQAFYTKRLKSLPEPIFNKIKFSAQIQPELRSDLFDLAADNDPTLELSKKLLLLSLDDRGYPSLAETLRSFARDVVLRHHCMRSAEPSHVFPRKDYTETFTLSDLWKSFKHIIPTPPSDSSNAEDAEAPTDVAEGKKKVGLKEMQEARINAFYCSLIWRFSWEVTSFSRLMAELKNSHLEFALDGRELEHEAITFLVSTKESNKLASLVHWFSKQENALIHAQQNLQQDVVRAHTERDQARAECEQAQQQNALLQAEIEALRLKLKSTVEASHVTGVHLKDDLEKNRGRTYQVLEHEVGVLNDCVTALQRNPPKIQVVQMYLPDVIDHLNDELKKLKD
ncbi:MULTISPECIES: hypothetical protein [Deefgea]|uniref:Uncharacterized protein n=1 Tax=Deefgea chitinilytica TaxID=570276 RepID=A0ABS2C8R0_9NEIS|nr:MULTISPECIES: hypothetical protein [Deefgea]MBM5570544.1 hypothetical protein [Deefgea chitinilytica]MBM9887773.1 hypothetical protein [Deefgea sp. CFH1-16]